MKNFNTAKLAKKLLTLMVACGFVSFAPAQAFYTQSTCDYAPLTTTGTELCLGDDAVSAAIPLGFTFNFYGVPFTNCYISSNGYMSFNSGLGSGCCTGAVLPSATYPNSIFFGQEDLDPNTCVDGTISYYTTGAPGSQIFVMSFVDVPHYPGPEGTFPVSVQVQLYEGTDEVRIVTTEYNGDGGFSTMGLNQNGTNADPVPGRNSADWSASDECISFVPSGADIEGCTDAAALNYDPAATVDDGSCVYGYTYSECSYDLMSTEGTVVCLGDDATSAAIPLGFTFHYYDQDFTQGYIKSNGAWTFDTYAGSLCCSGQLLPTGTYPYTIFIGQEDLDPNTCVDGEINYYTTGAPGSQVFVVNFVGVAHYPGPGVNDVSMQMQLFEATGEIRIELTNWPSDGGNQTCGLNWNGLYAQAAPGKNSTNWSATEECHSWVPAGVEICETPTGLYADGITGTSAVLHWDDMGGAGYQVTVREDGPGHAMITRAQAFTNSYTVTGLTPGTNYGFAVKTVCTPYVETSAKSYTSYFSTPLRLGESSSVELFPNPNNGNFTIQLNGLENEAVDVMVVDALGNVVYNNHIDINESAYTQLIDLSNAAAGVYQVSVISKDNRATYPVVIQK